MKILIAADDSGSLKQIVCQKGTDTSSQTAPQPKSVEQFQEQGLRNRVQKILVIKSKGDDRIIVAARANGQINFYSENTYDLIHTVSDGLIADSTEKDKYISLIHSFGVIVAASQEGKLTLIDLETLGKDVKVQYANVKGPLSAFVSHPEQVGIYAFGGKENDIKIARLFKDTSELFGEKELEPETLFEGKNVKNTKLDLRVPVWITSIIFVSLKEHTASSWEFITTTGYGEVRKYNTTEGRRPRFDKKFSQKSISCSSITPNEEEVVCADTHATTAIFNVQKGVIVAKYKGAVGAVQTLYTFLNGDKSLVATGGLDRYVRVFNVKTREQVAKVYVGSKISSIWILEDNAFEEEQTAEEANRNKRAKKTRKAQAYDKDADDVWNELDKLDKKKKRKI